MNFFKKMAEFGVVGLLGMCIDFFVTWLCKEKLRINKYIANSLGFITAVVSNFYLNLNWTFHANGQNTNVYFIRFSLIAIIGLALNNLIIYLFINKLSLNFYISKLIAVLCVFVWNFTANNYFNFHR
jgi:putative flippase GtrA